MFRYYKQNLTGVVFFQSCYKDSQFERGVNIIRSASNAGAIIYWNIFKFPLALTTFPVKCFANLSLVIKTPFAIFMQQC